MVKGGINFVKRLAALAAFCALLVCGQQPASASRETVRVGVSAHMPPYQFRSESGALAGLHIDLMNAIAERSDLDLQYVPFTRNSLCLEALRNGEVDVILGISSNEPAAAYFQSIGELSSSSLCMVQPRENRNHESPEEHSYSAGAAFEIGTVSTYLLPRLDVYSFSLRTTQEALFSALISDDVPAIIGDRNCITFQLRQAKLTEEYYISYNYLAATNYTAFVQEENQELYRRLEQGLSQLRVDGGYDRIYGSWIIDNDLVQAQKQIQRLVISITCIAVAGASVILFIWIMNRMLKRRVDEKTLALSHTNYELSCRMAELENEGVLRKLLIENSHVGTVLLDHSGTVLLGNSVACELAGIAQEELVGKKIWNVSVYGDLWRQILPRMETSKPQIISVERGGVRCNYRCLVHAIRKSGQAVLSAEDVTKEEQEKTALYEMEKNQYLNRIVAGVAHEIRNPLMAIRSFASLIVTDNGKDAEFQQAFSECVPREVDRINRLVETLIHYSRPIKGKKERFLLSGLLHDCLVFANLTARTHTISIESDVSEDVYLTANKDQIRQALINLILNSLESIEERIAQQPDCGPLKLKLSASMNKGHALLEIYDEGVGMSPDEITHCTEQFYTTKEHGTGLGMSLVQQFVVENGGTIYISSIKGLYTNIKLQF